MRCNGCTIGDYEMRQITEWDEWLKEYNSKYAAMTVVQRIKFLHDLIGSYPEGREKREIQTQIDRLASYDA